MKICDLWFYFQTPGNHYPDRILFYKADENNGNFWEVIDEQDFDEWYSENIDSEFPIVDFDFGSRTSMSSISVIINKTDDEI